MNPLTEGESFEAALEAAASYMANPPAAGSAGETEFDHVLTVIRDYADTLPAIPPEERAFDRRDRDLRSRLDALATQVAAAHPQDGEGIGPTLGMDLGRR